MIDQEKIRLMTRLAILEQRHSKEIRRAENSLRIDLISNPVWKRGFLFTLIFFAAAGILAALNINTLLNVVAGNGIRNLIMIVLILYLTLLAVTILISLASSLARARRISLIQAQYRSLLEGIDRIEAGRADRRKVKSGSRYDRGDEYGRGSKYDRGDEYGRGNGYVRDDEDDWEDDVPGQEYLQDDNWDQSSQRRRRPREDDDLDYRHTQTLEFEDDEFRYYVEATPKRGGRRG